jgi:hypothetical protein
MHPNLCTSSAQKMTKRIGSKEAMDVNDDEEMNLGPHSSLLKGDVAKPEDSIPLCGCLSVRYYQPYFNVDTSDVLQRMWSSFFFCRREETFLEHIIVKSPDAYGPIWVKQSFSHSHLIHPVLDRNNVDFYCSSLLSHFQMASILDAGANLDL